jgi:preprotein translocase SecE subunit
VAITGAVAAVLLLFGVQSLSKPGTQKWLGALEDQGWFSFTSYKKNQGVRVRRGTIIGILVLAAGGIWALDRTLRTEGEGDWRVALPFTGEVAVTAETAGDNPALKALVAEVEQDRAELERRRAEAEANVQRLEAELKKAQAQAEAGADLKALEEKVKQAKDDLNRLPAEVPDLTRGVFQLRDLNRAFQARHVKVAEPGFAGVGRANAREFQQGDVVSREEFEKEERERQAWQKKLQDEGKNAEADLVQVPKVEDARPAELRAKRQDLTLLPALQYTLPVVLAALSLWFAWRVVNVPAFADFLIATEAEMNKVSWSSRRQLVQDTIVVLVTVILMTIFLFVADITWSWILRSIEVLRPPPASTQPSGNQDVPW